MSAPAPLTPHQAYATLAPVKTAQEEFDALTDRLARINANRSAAETRVALFTGRPPSDKSRIAASSEMEGVRGQETNFVNRCVHVSRELGTPYEALHEGVNWPASPAAALALVEALIPD